MELCYDDLDSPVGQHEESPGRTPDGSQRTSSGQKRFRLVAIAASAGCVKAVGDVLSALPADFPVPVAVVLHRTASTPSLLGEVLSRRTPLAIETARSGEMMRPATVYLAPPDLHLLVHDGTFILTDGRKIRYVRSSANPLFESAAEALGDGVIAVVLTGYGSDGTDGVQAVKAHGGFVIAQDEATSEAHAMPGSAIQTGCVDRVLPLKKIAPAIVDLVTASSRQPPH